MKHGQQGFSQQQIEQAALRVDPWGDGKGDDRYVVLGNRIIVSRKAHKCALCCGAIGRGDRCRAQRECSDGKAVTFRICPMCVAALGLYFLTDRFELMELRYRLGMRRSQ